MFELRPDVCNACVCVDTAAAAAVFVAAQVSEIAGVKLDREVNVVAMADGQMLPLPPNSGVIGPDGKVRRLAAAAALWCLMLAGF